VMTVSELTARAQDDGQRLEGSSAAGHLLAYWWDFRSESAGWWSQCRETDHPGGGYQFTGMPVSGQDEGYVRLRGADGHYTERYARAFSVAINKDEPYMWGYTELPYASATVGLTRGGVVLGAWNPSSYSDGYFSVSLPSPLVFQAGDVVSVTTSDGDSAQVTVPPLTVSEDAARNELTGSAPAGKPVIADLVRVYGTRESGYTSYSMASRATAGADGRYRASFANMWWQRNNQCYAADVGHRCAYGNVRYYAPGDHRVSLSGPFPAPVSADSFEFDDNPANARPAGPMQYHTFHVQSDPDWVRITVPQSDVDRGVLYRLMTRNLGWGVDTVIELYASDGETLLAWNDDFPYPASRIDWRPQSAGVYYLKARPFSSWYGGAAHCDASYDLVVLPIRGTVLLPIQSK